MDLVTQSLEVMKDISRTAWESFIRCKRCFYLERKLKIKPIGMPGYPINSRVDALLKKEFDIYRDKQLRLILVTCNEEGQWRTIGAVDLYDYDPRNHRAGVGIVIDQNERRNGHAFVGLELLSKYAFEHLGVHQLYAEVPGGHDPSQAALDAPLQQAQKEKRTVG